MVQVKADAGVVAELALWRADSEDASVLTTILIADDHAIMRHGLRSLLHKQRDMHVVAEADNGRKAVEMALELRPDVVIMDIAMPEMNGIEATREILAAAPGTKILALSMHSDRWFTSEMFGAGAKGYLLKDCAFDELVQAIRAVISGKEYYSPAVEGDGH